MQPMIKKGEKNVFIKPVTIYIDHLIYFHIVDIYFVACNNKNNGKHPHLAMNFLF